MTAPMTEVFEVLNKKIPFSKILLSTSVSNTMLFLVLFSHTPVTLDWSTFELLTLTSNDVTMKTP